MELRITRDARDRYGLDAALFSTRGDVVGADPAVARALVRRMHAAGAARPDRPLLAGDLAALGLIHELSHVGITRERTRGTAGGPLAAALPTVAAAVGPERLDAALGALEHHFPATDVYRGDRSVADRLAGARDGVDGREEALEELLLLWVANRNPAALAWDDLVGEEPLTAEGDAYPAVIGALRRALAAADGAPAGADGSLVDRLLAPARAHPTSLADQLRYIRDRWGDWVDPALLARIAIAIGVADEEAATLRRVGADAPDFSAGPGVAGSPGHGVRAAVGEPEAFSPDRDWMPSCVLIAKSTYVWLDQLSRRHGREIRTLDAIPDAELDMLAARGITGLWLIGLWERSVASRTIKQRRGDADAAASAYALMDYRIADDLGGDAAWLDLRDRAWARGIRLASDMVPNHMGIDADWVRDHPERFLGRDDPPYPGYTFHGPDLSPHPGIEVRIEDHYWDATDAAVVFQRVDRATGRVRYLYHGNDGTSFPWNDTAQIDYLDPEAREAVIRTIIDVARRFPIIRFDAAMVLARKHVQRLWYPLPGAGGAIPSRAEAAIPQAELDRRMPAEFWREVVDRVAAEAPGTLLLAEAFWLLEGYFVRTLGMHRVYNSAFMHMLRDEDNAGYRSVIRETAGFDGRILGRFVNFMSNPDEKTAIEQFGDGDKYFGVASLLATMPGLPMLGHGQLEGLAERYGMEFRRARTHEEPRAGLLARHEREIVPLLRERRRFAGAEHFRLLDAVRPDGSVDEDVFAYTNRAGDARSLVVYRNRWAEGRVRIPDVAEALAADPAPGAWLVLHDARSGLDFLRHGGDLAARGLELDLRAYGGHVFLDPRVVHDGPGTDWGALAARIGLAGVPDVHAALRDLRLAPLRAAIGRALRPELPRAVADAVSARTPEGADALAVDAADRLGGALAEVGALVASGGAGSGPLTLLPDAAGIAGRRAAARLMALVRAARAGALPGGRATLSTLTAWIALDALAALLPGGPGEGPALAAEVVLGTARGPMLPVALAGGGLDPAAADAAADRARALAALADAEIVPAAPVGSATGAAMAAVLPPGPPAVSEDPAAATRVPVVVPGLAVPAAAAAGSSVTAGGTGGRTAAVAAPRALPRGAGGPVSAAAGAGGA
ncbi:MAG: alpha-amylase family glycosyl hydrolase, partial [Chloroflexota bacterium]